MVSLFFIIENSLDFNGFQQRTIEVLILREEELLKKKYLFISIDPLIAEIFKSLVMVVSKLSTQLTIINKEKSHKLLRKVFIQIKEAKNVEKNLVNESLNSVLSLVNEIDHLKKELMIKDQKI